jgi:hypothetical protein
MRLTALPCLLALSVSAAAAQSASAPASVPSPTPAAVPPAEQQIAAAVLPLPKDLRAGASVLGYSPDGKLVSLHTGSGDMTCLASDPAAPRFHVACYHKSMEPFMARGRALRAQGVKGDQVDSVRFAEARSGKLALPKQPAALYTLTGPVGSFDPATGVATGARALYVVYIPYATAASTGLSAVPVKDAPWIMFPGTPKAHIMFVAGM